MRRSVFIIAVLLVIIIFGIVFENNLISELSDVSKDKLNEMLTTSDNTSLADIYSEYIKNWNFEKNSLSYMISHEDTDDISMHNALLKAAIGENEIWEIKSEICQLLCLYDELEHKFRISPKNIL